MQRQPLSSLPLLLGIARCSCNGSALPLPPNSGLPELGISRSSKSDISDFDRERVGVRGYGLSLVQRPLTRFAAQTDLSPLGRGELNPPAPAKFQDTCSSSSNNC